MGVNSNVPVGQDVLRGLRWGMITLIAALLAIAVYRVVGTSPATAAPKVQAAPLPDPSTPQQPAIQAGEGTPSQEVPAVTGPDVPPAPPPRRHTAPVEPEDHSKAFIPPSVTTPRGALQEDLTESLPDVQPIDVKAAPVAAGKAVAMPRQEEKGSRVGKVAKSVGKIFGFGRNEPPPPPTANK